MGFVLSQFFSTMSMSKSYSLPLMGIGISFFTPSSVPRILSPNPLQKPSFETSASSPAPHSRTTSDISVSSTSPAAGSKTILVPAPERWEVHPSHQSGRDEPRRITMESALPKILILRAALRSSQRSMTDIVFNDSPSARNELRGQFESLCAIPFGLDVGRIDLGIGQLEVVSHPYGVLPISQFRLPLPPLRVVEGGPVPIVVGLFGNPSPG